MRIRTTLGIGFGSIAVLIMSTPGVGQAQKPRIKVTVENASIRLKPDAASDIIANAAMGSLYDVEAKTGEWYEVKHRTNVGILVTGYIHEMFVELEKPAVNTIPAKEAQAKVQPPTVRESTAAEPPGGPTLGIHIGLKISALAAFWSGYDYEYSVSTYGEKMRITDAVDKSVAMGFNVEASVFLMKNFELTGGLNVLSKKTVGHFGFELPNIYLYNDIASDEAEANPSRRIMEVDFGLNYHIFTGGALTPYVGLGGAYVMAKMDLLEDIVFQETYYSDNKHSLTITDVKFVEKTVNKFGFFGRAGLNIEIARNIGLFLEGKYVVAKTEAPHPLTSQFDANEKLSLDFGGPSARIGIRVLI